MAKFSYPDKETLTFFIEIITNGDFTVSKYLPGIDEEWYRIIGNCIELLQIASKYTDLSIEAACAEMLYKVAKRHEFGDGNKRSAVITVFIFSYVNGFWVRDPKLLKLQAKIIASTKGRVKEEVIKQRVALRLKSTLMEIEE